MAYSKLTHEYTKIREETRGERGSMSDVKRKM